MGTVLSNKEILQYKKSVSVFVSLSPSGSREASKSKMHLFQLPFDLCNPEIAGSTRTQLPKLTKNTSRSSFSGSNFEPGG